MILDVLESAKEERDRHQHNIRIARRRQERRRQREAAEAPPEKEKARELIEFLVKNGLVDHRRNASLVIKAFVSGFLARQRGGQVPLPSGPFRRLRLCIIVATTPSMDGPEPW